MIWGERRVAGGTTTPSPLAGEGWGEGWGEGASRRKGDPGLPPLRGALRCSTGQAAAELALRAQTVLAEIP